jgi:hypothetical protein
MVDMNRLVNTDNGNIARLVFLQACGSAMSLNIADCHAPIEIEVPG